MTSLFSNILFCILFSPSLIAGQFPNQRAEFQVITNSLLSSTSQKTMMAVCEPEDAVLTLSPGEEKSFFIVHKSGGDAYNIRPEFPNDWTDVSISSSSCGILKPGWTCQIVIHVTEGSLGHSQTRIPVIGDGNVQTKYLCFEVPA